MIRTAEVPTMTEPKLIDKALLDIQTSLTAKLSWLDRAFGRSELRKEIKDGGREIVSPSVYTGENEYLKLFPDSHIGNFTFFDIEDGQEIDHRGRSNVDFEAKFGLIVWFDFRTVYPADWQNRTTENVKDEVIEALKTTLLPDSSIKLTRYWDRSKNVYRGYTNTEIAAQYYMRPFGGFRLDGIISFRSTPNC